MSEQHYNEFLLLWKRYLQYFNEHNIEGVKSMNDTNLKSFYNGAMTAGSMEEVLPYYLKDFEDGSIVDLIKVEQICNIPEESQIAIQVMLLKKTLKEQILVGMRYYFNVETKVMVKHEVLSVEVVKVH